MPLTLNIFTILVPNCIRSSKFKHSIKITRGGIKITNTKIEELPQELYDEIKALSLNCQPGGVHRIGPAYQPPVQLQIDSTHRQAFSRAYYSNASDFMISNSTEGMLHFGKWISSLPEEPLTQLQQQYGVSDPAVLDDSIDVHLEMACGRRLRVWCEQKDQNGWLRVLKVKIYKD